MTFSESFIYKKISSLEEYINELTKLLHRYTDNDFLNDSEKMHATERLVQLIVDIMIDINQHFIRELNLTLSDSLQSTFIIMGENNILPKEFAVKIAPVTGVRNILVHQYEKLDKQIFLKNLRHHFSDFSKFKQYITTYLDNH